LSTCFDEDGKAKIVLGIDDSDGDDIVEDQGATARERRKARAKAREEAAPQVVAVIPAAKPAVRPGKANVNPFARPTQISLDADEPKKKKDSSSSVSTLELLKKHGRSGSRSMSRETRRKMKRAERLMEAAGGLDAALTMATSGRFAGGVNRAAANDMCTGGTSIGPMTMGLADPTQLGKQGICIKHLSGSCQMNAETCPQKHTADPAERMKWVKYFNTQACKYGAACTVPKCIYEHPNRPGWCGENVNLIKGSLL